MDRRNLNWITWGFVGATVLVIALMLSTTLRRTAYITLPETSQNSSQTTDTEDFSENALTSITVTPDTVQAAIATLSRPEHYRRTVTVEQFWNGGSGAYETNVSVSGSWTRMDRMMPDGQTKHTILGEDTVYIWYNQESDVYSAPRGNFSADHEQTIPTYEEILELEPDLITVADFRKISDADCIYVETGEDSAGYRFRYWVSVDTGLLTVAEKLVHEEPVYRMASLFVDQVTSTESDFVLPDGTSLL